MVSKTNSGECGRRQPRGRPPAYARDLDKLVKTVCGGLIRQPETRPGTPLDSADERRRWWKAFHWWLKASPEALRARLRFSERYQTFTRPSQSRIVIPSRCATVEYGPLPAELVFFLHEEKGVALDEPLIRDTIAYWQHALRFYDSRSPEAQDTRRWLNRIAPHLIPPDLRGSGHRGVGPYLPWGYEVLESWIAALVKLYEMFPGPEELFKAAVDAENHPYPLRGHLITLRADLYEGFCTGTPGKGPLTGAPWAHEQDDDEPTQSEALRAKEAEIEGFLRDCLSLTRVNAAGGHEVSKAGIRRMVAKLADVKEETVRHALSSTRRSTARKS